MLGSSLLISLDNDAPPYIEYHPGPALELKIIFPLMAARGLVVTLTAFRLEARFVVEIPHG
jgi:hypothetical protein